MILDGRKAPLDLSPSQIQWIGDRHRGVGFDQLVLLQQPDQAAISDIKLTFYNADGSEAGACGNASRCVASLIGEELTKSELVMETKGGQLHATLLDDGRVRVLMATPGLRWQDVPVSDACDTVELPVNVSGLPQPVGVSMGNPHAVFFVDDVDLVERHGHSLERHELFPERANIGFANIIKPDRIRLRVHERGVGLTLACGSGACAALVAAVRRGLVLDHATMVLDGGELEVAWPGEGPVAMTGHVSKSFSGEIDWAVLA